MSDAKASKSPKKRGKTQPRNRGSPKEDPPKPKGKVKPGAPKSATATTPKTNRRGENRKPETRKRRKKHMDTHDEIMTMKKNQETLARGVAAQGTLLAETVAKLKATEAKFEKLNARQPPEERAEFVVGLMEERAKELQAKEERQRAFTTR